MNRTALLGALVVALIACSMAFSTPRPAHALRCCDNAYYATSHWWAMGASCSEAENKFLSDLMPSAQAICDPERVCNVSIPDCFYDSMKQAWLVEGQMYFGCTYYCIPEA